MTGKEYLMQAYQIDRQINSKLEQVMALKELACRASSLLSDTKVKGSKPTCRMQEVVVKMVDLENDINDSIDFLVDLKREISRAIEELPEINLRTVLELRYLCFYSWDKIAEEMGFSRQHVNRLHHKAIKNLKYSKDVTKCD
jgi:DNA-directed RNA polymerase specialized sigma subunit